jgi:uncharacterized protein involved in exopolysaccharide biosynthesis
MSRDYIAAQTNYQTLLQKQQDAQMAAALEQHNGGESFRILDPADRPSHPFAPNLPLIDGVGMLSALFLGILLAFVADMRDATIHDSTELIRYLDIPLITAIPKISTVQKALMRQLAGDTR